MVRDVSGINVYSCLETALVDTFAFRQLSICSAFLRADLNVDERDTCVYLGFMQDLGPQLRVHTSYYEVYNELVYDLMTPAPSQRQRVALKLRENAQGQVTVQGLVQVCTSGFWAHVHKPVFKVMRAQSEQRARSQGTGLAICEFLHTAGC